MISKKPLQVHAYDDLLILYWRRDEKIASQINVLLDDAPVGKPLLGMEFVERPDYILAAQVQNIAKRGPFVLKITDADANILAEVKAKKAPPIPKKLLASWSLASRTRLEKALLVQSRRVLPQLGDATRAQVAAALAETHTRAIHGPDGWWYIRLPWSSTTAPGLLDATLRAFPDGKTPEFSETIKAFLDGDFLHLFTRRLPALPWSEDRLWVLDAGDIRYLPFSLREPSELPLAGHSPETWLQAITTDYSGNPAILRGFATSVMGPARPRTPSSLAGQVEGMRAGRVIGWAFDSRQPQHPVRLNVVVDGELLGEIEAHLPRPDSDARGYGNCGFVWQPDAMLMHGEAHEIRIYCAETGDELRGSPLRLGRGEYDGEYRLDETGALVGWVRERCSPPRAARVSLLIDDQPPAMPVTTLAEPITSDGRCHFFLAMPDQVFDTTPHILDVLVSDGEHGGRLEQRVRVQADYRGHIDYAGPDRLSGWIVNTVAPGRPVTLDLWVNGRAVATGLADDVVKPDASEQPADRCGFELIVPPETWLSATLTLELCLAGTSVKVLGPSILYTPYDIAVRALTTLAEMLNDPDRWRMLSGGLAFDEDVTSWMRTQIIARVLGELRRAKRIPPQVELPLAALIKMPRREIREPIVDVIVPVYLGRDDALRCLASVLAARAETPMELVVIDDAGPDPDLSAELRRLAGQYGFTLLVNTDNLGFVGAVNRGMRLHPRRDVVLLNADSVVAPGWLDRLQAAAHSAHNIGTATPFSNNATICSFPKTCQENPIPLGQSVERLDALFARANPGQVMDIPTAVGFCMYIRREVLEEIGYFDEAQWGKGYAEENDFCLRASTVGWRHIAACDVFVEHKGGVSFAEQKQDRLQHNLAKLNGLYPDYAMTIQRFIAQDPLARARNRVAKRLLQEHASRYMLFVIHGLGGGTQTAADHLARRLARENVAVLELMAMTPDHWRLICHGFPYEIHYRYPEDQDTVIQDLRDLGVWHIHYHQTMHFPRSIWDYPEYLGVAYDFTVHDYLTICPRINMIDESGGYCGDAQYSADNCTRCVRMNGLKCKLDKHYAEFGGEVGAWRSSYGELLRKARRVFAPSQDAAQRVLRHYPLTNLSIQPHPEPRQDVHLPPRPEGADTVAVIGAIGQHKGYDMLLRCVRNAEKEGLPLKFVVIGFTHDDETLRKSSHVTITGEYRQDELPRLIAQSGAKVALFLSPWPETYCYALSEAWRNGLYPVGLEIGAIAERIGEAGCGRLLPLHSDARSINQALLDVLAEHRYAPPSFVMGGELASVLGDYYGLGFPHAEDDADGARRARA